MKKINYIKIILDTMMVLIFVLLFNTKVLGVLFHEVAGLAIGAVILVHCVLNWKWVKVVTLKIFKSKLPTKTRIGFFIDIVLLLNFIVIIISGAFISKTVFASLELSGAPFLKSLHISMSYFSLLLIGIHVGLHWNWVILTFRKILKISEKKKAYSYISKFMVILILSFGMYSINDLGVLSKISIAPIISSITSSNDAGNRVFKGDSKSMNGPNGTAHGKERKKGSGLSEPSVLVVITSYLGVISVFSIITFYTEKILIKRKKKISEICF